MKGIKNGDELKAKIAELEKQKDIDEAAIKYEFKETYETYKPANILKNTLSEVSASPTFKHNLLNVALGLGAGYLSKKLVIGRSAGLFKRVVGTALQFGVTSLVAKKGAKDDPQTKKRGSLLKRIFSRTSTPNS
ncbi:MAG: hypothetical protein ABIR81_06395 [Ginsengibacter sp.]